MSKDPVAPFKALEWQKAPWRDKSPVMLLTGSAGGGKSKLAGEKVNAFLKKYPRATGIVVRKTRSSMSNSTLLFMERNVIGRDPFVKHAPTKRRFEYRNGSVLAYGGMNDENQREQLRSVGQDGSVDIAWMEEANRFDENDFNELQARIRGRAANWLQVILSTNPDSPAHWIYKRMIVGGEASVHLSAAKDNPHNPSSYVHTLQRLTGVLKDRLADGLWVQAEGLVYSMFDASVHVVPAFEVPRQWRRFLAIDFGYWPSPFVCQWWAMDPMDNLYMYRELYGTKRRVREWANLIAALTGRENIDAGYADHDDESMETLQEVLPFPVGPAVKDMETGLQLVMERLITEDADGNPVDPRLYFMRNALVEEDQELLAVKRPTSTLEEITLYVWGDKLLGSGKERPLKAHDHGMDAMRYLVTTLDRGTGSLSSHANVVRPVTAGMRGRTF